MRWLVCFVLALPLYSFANCDLSTYRWDCEMVPELNPGKHRIQAFCDGTPVYLTKKQWLILKRYERSYVNLVLKVNGEYFSGPCRVARK